jgi:hypothetical protein
VKVGIMIATAVVVVIVVLVIVERWGKDCRHERPLSGLDAPSDASLTSPPHGAWCRLPRHALVDRAA